MSAYLDRNRMGADYTGVGISDPRLVNRLQHIGPSQPTTLEQLAAALDAVAHYAGKKRLSARSAATLNEMIFGAEVAREKEAA